MKRTLRYNSTFTRLEKAQELHIRTEVSTNALFSVFAAKVTARTEYFFAVDKNSRFCPVKDSAHFRWHLPRQLIRIKL
jgi:hypothetical protein